MGNVIIGATMSLDWFMNDRNGDVSRLYPDLEALRQTEMLQEEIRTTGAVVMGRRAHDMAEGDLTDYEYQVPIFVLTHHLPQQVVKGENDQLTVTFVTDGIHKTIEQAKAAAEEKHVMVVGGAIFVNDTPTTELYTLSLHDALAPIRPANSPRVATAGSCRYVLACSQYLRISWHQYTARNAPNHASSRRRQSADRGRSRSFESGISEGAAPQRARLDHQGPPQAPSVRVLRGALPRSPSELQVARDRQLQKQHWIRNRPQHRLRDLPSGNSVQCRHVVPDNQTISNRHAQVDPDPEVGHKQEQQELHEVDFPGGMEESTRPFEEPTDADNQHHGHG